MAVKNILLLTCVLLNLSVFAQNIQVKKNKILYNKKEIAQFEKKNKWYMLSDLSGKYIVKIKPNINEINDNNREIYYEVSSPDDSILVSVFNKSDKSPLSFEKKILEDFMLGEYKLFTSDGLDMEVVQNMLSSSSDVKTGILAKAKAVEDEENRVVKLIDILGVSFKDRLGENGEIIRNNTEIGYFARKADGGGYLYELFNKKKNLIGVWYSMRSNVNFAGKTYSILNNELVLINGEKNEISGRKANPSSRVSMDKMALIILGYALDNNLLY